MAAVTAPREHVEYVVVDGIPFSWYCAHCTRELGALSCGDPRETGQPDPCECGEGALAWEPWIGEIDTHTGYWVLDHVSAELVELTGVTL